MPSAVVLQCPIKPSPRFAVSLLLLHMMAAAAVFATAMPWMAKSSMLLLVVLSLAYYARRDVLLLQPDSWSAISLEQREVSVVTRGGAELNGQVSDNTFVSPYFVVLRVRLEGRHLPASRVLFPDSTSAGTYRELCVHLRFA